MRAILEKLDKESRRVLRRLSRDENVSVEQVIATIIEARLVEASAEVSLN